jgi:type I restriction enzyme M protein
MIDASRGFMKDGPKNRLREMDIHRIVDVFRRGVDLFRYARMVGYDEIEKNDFNLNLPRYIDSRPPEDRQDIEGHLKGGIPERDVEALAPHWTVCPNLKALLFRPNRPGYLDLTVRPEAIRAAIHDHAEFRAFTEGLTEHFAARRKRETEGLKALVAGWTSHDWLHSSDMGEQWRSNADAPINGYKRGVYDGYLFRWSRRLLSVLAETGLPLRVSPAFRSFAASNFSAADLVGNP